MEPTNKSDQKSGYANDHTDPSFQVMPTLGRVPTPMNDTPAPVSDSFDSPPGRSKFVYIIAGVVALLIVAGLAYYFLVGKKSTTPADQAAVSKLPKVWLQQYFQKDVCDDQKVCADNVDPDSDGLNNYDEFKDGTSPVNSDSDSDGLADGDEVNIYNTDPALRFTDRRDVVQENTWTDGVQVKNNYDPLTPSIKFTDTRKQQIADDTTKFGLHEPTTTTLSATQ